MVHKVAIFIDGSNLFYACKELKFKIDMLKLRDVLVGDRELLRPYYYHSFDPNDEGQIKFHHFLQNNGFTVKAIPLRQRGEKQVEKGADVRLVTDMLALGFKGAYDIAIVVSGDSDFIDAIEEIKRSGKRVEVAMFEHVVSSELKRSVDRFISLNTLTDKIALEK